MAWFHNTLKDMKKAIEREDWDEVKRLLALHNFHHYGRNVKKEIEHDIYSIGMIISDYGDNLIQILAGLSYEGSEVSNKDHMITKVDDAIECALRFEETIKSYYTFVDSYTPYGTPH